MANKVISIEKKQNETYFEGNITKVKINNKGIPEIAYTHANKQCSKETKAKGDKEPKDSFFCALNALKPFFVDVCEIKHKLDETKIIGISFDDTGVVITGLIELTENDISSPMCINTPHIFYVNQSGEFEVPEDVKKLFNEVKKEAIEYMSGDTKFKQRNLLKQN